MIKTPRLVCKKLIKLILSEHVCTLQVANIVPVGGQDIWNRESHEAVREFFEASMGETVMVSKQISLDISYCREISLQKHIEHIRGWI